MQTDPSASALHSPYYYQAEPTEYFYYQPAAYPQPTVVRQPQSKQVVIRKPDENAA